MLHDYQIANSVTINSILLNYIVNVQYAMDTLLNRDGNEIQEYFAIVDSLDEVSGKMLDDDLKLLLYVDDEIGDGTFKTRWLEYQVKRLEDNHIREFVNLDSIWYGICPHDNHDTIELIPEMNDFSINPSPFGTENNPFGMKPSESDRSFNGLMQHQQKNINCIVENWFYLNWPETESTNQFGFNLKQCKYIACLNNRLYGLKICRANDA